jgi:predicted transcriptional regulator
VFFVVYLDVIMTDFIFSVKLTNKIKMGKSIRSSQHNESMFKALITERTDLNLTEFLKAVGIPHKTWRRWVTGETTAKLTLPQIKAICKTLNFKSVDELPNDFSEKYQSKN